MTGTNEKNRFRNSKKLQIAFTGVPNCGKTTLFNLCTGAALKTANFAGVTVEAVQRTGKKRQATENCIFTDLPGMYSLISFTPEEKTAAGALLSGGFDCTVQVASAVSPARSLYLCLQLLEAGIRPILALNLFDEAKRRGMHIDCGQLSSMLGITVVPISAKQKWGLDLLLQEISAADKANGKTASSSPFYKNRLGDGEKYAVIDRLISKCVDFGKNTGGKGKSEKLDRFLLHPFWGIPLFFAGLSSILTVTSRIGDFLGEALAGGMSCLCRIAAAQLQKIGCAPPLVSLLTEGIGGGISGVLSFLPYVLLLIFFLTLLEDSGYLPRTAYLFDGILQRCGLSGKALLPMLLGFGCSVPAILGTRILENPSERRRAILLIPFFCCSARLPILLYVASAFFRKQKTVFLLLFYFAGIFTAYLLGRLSLLWQRKRGKAPGCSYLLTELPDYHFPSLPTALRAVKERLFDTLKRACGIVFLASLLLWCAQNFGPAGYCSGDPASSFETLLGNLLLPFLRPIGLAYLPVAAALPAGIAAKEAMVAALEISLGEKGFGLLQAAGFGIPNALSLLCFALLYTPCTAALAVIRRESGSRKAVFISAAGQLFVAYVLSFLVYQGARLFL